MASREPARRAPVIQAMIRASVPIPKSVELFVRDLHDEFKLCQLQVRRIHLDRVIPLASSPPSRSARG
jgi:hypothetical protein